MLKKITLAAALVMSCASALVLADTPATVSATSKGGILVDSKGMTLYTFTKDTAGKSACNGPCASNWPPLMASAAARGSDGYSVITRDDGSRQWAYKDRPLYTWVKDSKPGDTTGDGVNSVWQVAKP